MRCGFCVIEQPHFTPGFRAPQITYGLQPSGECGAFLILQVQLRPANEDFGGGGDCNEGIEDKCFTVLFHSDPSFVPRHVVAGVGYGGGWKREVGEIGEFLEDGFRHRVVDLRALGFPCGDEASDDAPRRGRPLGDAFVDMPAPLGGVEAPGEKSDGEGGHGSVVG